MRAPLCPIEALDPPLISLSTLCLFLLFHKAGDVKIPQIRTMACHWSWWQLVTEKSVTSGLFTVGLLKVGNCWWHQPPTSAAIIGLHRWILTSPKSKVYISMNSPLLGAGVGQWSSRLHPSYRIRSISLGCLRTTLDPTQQPNRWKIHKSIVIDTFQSVLWRLLIQWSL